MASGLTGWTGKTWSSTAETTAVTAMTGTAHSAPRPISTTALPPSGPTPIVCQSRAPVSTTSRRTSATYTSAWIVTDRSAPIGPSSGTPSRSSGMAKTTTIRAETGIAAAKTSSGDGPR